MSTKQTYPIEIVNGLGLNQEQRLYVIQHSGGGISCFGFDNCYEETKQLADVMNLAGPSPDMLGTRECYQMNKALHEAYRTHHASKRTWYSTGTPKKVASILEAARASFTDHRADGTVLRLFFGCPETGRDLCEEMDSIGYIGRSMGPMRVPLILEPLLDEERNIVPSECGGAISTTRILRIIDVRRAEEVYRAKNYVLPQFSIEASEGTDRYRVAVLRDGQSVARFEGHEEAARWIAFMQGFRVHQPYRTLREYRAELMNND